MKTHLLKKVEKFEWERWLAATRIRIHEFLTQNYLSHSFQFLE